MPSRAYAVPIVLGALLCAWTAPGEENSPSPASGVYMSAIYENERAMAQSDARTVHRCVWKGRERKRDKVICKWHTQLKCGAKGWYKVGPC